MTASVGWSELEIRAALSRTFGSDLEREASMAGGGAGTKAGKIMGGNMGRRASSAMHEQFKSAAKYIVGPLIGAFAIEKVGEVVKESIQGAADLEAANRRLKVIYGDEANAVDKFGEKAAKSYGIGDLAARKAASGFGILYKNAGLSRKENEKSSVQMVKLAADLAAFNNADPSTVFTALQRGVAGSTRGLKPLGIIIDSTGIKAEALADNIVKPVKDSAKIHAAQTRVLSDTLALGAAIKAHGKNSQEAAIAQGHLEAAQAGLNVAIDGTVPPLTAQQKILASTNLILKQTTDQQGAFHRSSGDLVEQQRILTASWDNAKDRLGRGLLPIERDLVHELNEKLIPAIDHASKWFDQKGAPALHHFAQEAGPVAKDILPLIADGLGAAWHVVKRLAPDVKSLADEFNGFPKWAKDALVAGGAAAYVGKKTGIFGRGAPGAGAEAALVGRGSPENPMYVIALNGGKGGLPLPVGTGGGGLGSDFEKWAAELAGAKYLPKIPAAPSLAVGAQILHGLKGLIDIVHRSHTSPNPNDARSLQGSFIGGAQGLKTTNEGTIDINFAKLAHGLQTRGSNSPYAQQVLSQLKNGKFLDSGGGVFGNNAVSRADSALRDLQKAMKLAGTTGTVIKPVASHIDAISASVERESRSLELMGHNGGRDFQALQANASNYRRELGRLPVNVQTKVLTPGLVESQTDIEKLQQRFALNPKQVTTLFKLLGIKQATEQFDGLQRHMGQHQVTSQTIDLGGHPTNGGINVQGDVHIHGDQRAGSEWRRRTRQRANSDGVRRG